MARRHRKNEIEGPIDLAFIFILPCRLGLILAVLSYLQLHQLAEAPVPPATSPNDIAGPCESARCSLRSPPRTGQGNAQTRK
jgi:hypothetical protein